MSFVALGVVHAALGLQAFRVYRGLSAASGITERATATEAFVWPGGDWLVVLAGLGFIGFAVQQIYAAITCRLERDLDVAKMRREAGEWAVALLPNHPRALFAHPNQTLTGEVRGARTRGRRRCGASRVNQSWPDVNASSGHRRGCQ